MRYLTLGMILFSTVGHALGFGEFNGWMKALYWTPTTPPFTYLQTSTSLTNGNEFIEEFMGSFDHNWGVEVGGGFCRCGDSILELRGLWIRNSRSFSQRITSTSSQELIIASLPEFSQSFFDSSGFTSSQVRSQYWAVCLTLNQELCSRPCFSFVSSVGGRYVNLRQFLSTTGTFVTPFGTLRSEAALSQSYNGGGIEASIRGKWNLGRSLALSGEASGLAIIGVSKTNVNVSRNTLRNLSRQPSSTRIVPGLDASLDLAFSRCSWGIYWGCSVGYTIHHYFSVYQTPQTLFLLGSADQGTYVDSGYAGPYFSIGAKF